LDRVSPGSFLPPVPKKLILLESDGEHQKIKWINKQQSNPTTATVFFILQAGLCEAERLS